MANLKRLNKELKNINKLLDGQPDFDKFELRPEVDDNLLKWTGHILGPEGSPYEGGIFFLEMNFPKEYPFKPPKVKFQTRIYHMNINDDGQICLYMLKEGWTPKTSVIDILNALHDLFVEPNPDDPLKPEIAKLYVDDNTAYIKKAMEETEKYAQ